MILPLDTQSERYWEYADVYCVQANRPISQIVILKIMMLLPNKVSQTLEQYVIWNGYDIVLTNKNLNIQYHELGFTKQTFLGDKYIRCLISKIILNI